MAAYSTLRDATHRLPPNRYLEVARKRLTEDGHSTDFLLITCGFLDERGEKRWTRFVTIPDDAQARAWLSRMLLEL